MQVDATVAFVLAGGQGTRLYPLTAEHAKPALPFTGRYRIIDFVLSNLINSGIHSIYVLAQHKPASLLAHLRQNWPESGSARQRCAVRVIMPPAGSASGRFLGTADAVYKSRHVLDRHPADLVAVFAADHIYRMDVRQMIAFHRSVAAHISVAACPVRIEQASRFGIMVTGPDQRVLEFQEKPQRPHPMPGDPTRAYASMGNYLFDRTTLLKALEEGHQRGETDFGSELVPRLIHTHRVFAYDFTHNIVPGIQPYEESAYWRDVGTIDALHAARRDTLGLQPRFNLDNPAWPIAAAGRATDRPETAAASSWSRAPGMRNAPWLVNTDADLPLRKPAARKPSSDDRYQ